MKDYLEAFLIFWNANEKALRKMEIGDAAPTAFRAGFEANVVGHQLMRIADSLEVANKFKAHAREQQDQALQLQKDLQSLVNTSLPFKVFGIDGRGEKVLVAAFMDGIEAGRFKKYAAQIYGNLTIEAAS